MFKIIEPKAHEYHNHKIDSLLGLLRIYQNFYLSPETQGRATFIIAEDDKRSIYGGAVLYPRKVSLSADLMPEDTKEEILGKLFLRFQPKVKEYWTARICLCIGHDSSTPLLEAVELCQRFYQNLYKAFAYFGEKEGIEYITFTLRMTDAHVDNTLHILTYETLPYLLRVGLSGDSDGLFHGILSLNGNYFKPRKKARRSLISRRTNFSSYESSPSEGRSA